MIEDIEYLLKNCEKDSTTIYIDSGDRDQRYYPNPSEYTITFDQPFKLVNGFDILDGSIPTTMYNVDVYNNALAISLVSRPQTALSIDRTKMFLEIDESLLFANIFEAYHETFLIVTQNSPESNWVLMNNSEEIKDTYFVAVRQVLSNVTFVSVKHTKDPNLYYIKYNEVDYGIPIVSSNLQAIEYLETGNATLSINMQTNTLDVVYFQFYKVPQISFTTLLTTNQYILHIKNYMKEIETGNYDVSTLRNELNSTWNISNINFESTTSLDRKQGKILISSEDLIVLNAKKSTLANNLGFSTLPRASESTLYSYTTVGSNPRIFIGNFYTTDNVFKIYPPGIVNLLGERFLILRCPEIESHLLGSYAYNSTTPGMGLFKLAASYNDVTHLRFDYVSLVRKPFHPIGKLSKMTFRFELSNGKIYDFKGINHQILFVIKFLVPTQKMNFQKSILNPNYDADFMKYMSKHRSMQYREESDEEQSFEDARYLQQYKKDMEKYNYDVDASDSDDDFETNEGTDVDTSDDSDM